MQTYPGVDRRWTRIAERSPRHFTADSCHAIIVFLSSFVLRLFHAPVFNDGGGVPAVRETITEGVVQRTQTLSVKGIMGSGGARGSCWPKSIRADMEHEGSRRRSGTGLLRLNVISEGTMGFDEVYWNLIPLVLFRGARKV